MAITFDLAKRDRTLLERGLDFAEAANIFEGPTFTTEDVRHKYGEVRWVTYGLLGGRLVSVVWTGRGENRHVISLRKCNEREQARYRSRLA